MKFFLTFYIFFEFQKKPVYDNKFKQHRQAMFYPKVNAVDFLSQIYSKVKTIQNSSFQIYAIFIQIHMHKLYHIV